MSSLRLSVLVAILWVGSALCWADEKKPTLKDDQKTLQGVWQTESKSRGGLKVEFKADTLAIEADLPGRRLIVDGIRFQLKETKKARRIELNEAEAKVIDIQKLVYQLDKDQLTLTASEGALKGEWKLTRKK